MRRVLGYLIRFAVVIFGYALASLAASVFLNLTALGARDLAGEEGRAATAAALFVMVPLVAVLVAYFAFIPAAVVILIAEILALRDWLTYSIAGGSIALMVVAVASHASEFGYVGARGPGAAATIVGAGLFAGLVYWLAAGRRAGSQLAVEKPTSPAQ